MSDETTSNDPSEDDEEEQSDNNTPNTRTDTKYTRVKLEDEMRQSYLGYAMSVIIGRALPDIRDGLKPVHRRCLFGMHELNNRHDRPPMKSARVSGEVMGKYHPHGELAIYNTIVIMAQDFKMRYPLVDGQGNFGSIDGDPAAASRYTEVRMSKIAGEMLADLRKETVDMMPNYDETLRMPVVLPTRTPNLLINGAQGIAVGMATNIPPHNIGEVVDACIALVDDESLDTKQLMEYVKGPDFPTAAIINGIAGIYEAYETGRGQILVRARASVEVDKAGRESIVITEIPFQLNKAKLVEAIAQLVREQRITGISELRDESSKDGLRVVIEVKKSEKGEIVLNNLYTQTQLQTSFSVNSVALIDGQPRVVTLKEMLIEFVRHRREVIIRRTIFQLREDRKRGHTLEGQAVALADIDEIVELIRSSSSSDVAREALMRRDWLRDGSESTPARDRDARVEGVRALLRRADVKLARRLDIEPALGFNIERGTYRLSLDQANAILSMQLHRLVSLEREKLIKDFESIIENIKELQKILDSEDRMNEVVKEELTEIRTQYGDERRTEIRSSIEDLSITDLITPTYVLLTISHGGYAKVQPLNVYGTQRRGGHGKIALTTKDGDYVEHVHVVHNHSTLLCFSNKGRVYWLPVYNIPEESRNSRGKPLVNMIEIHSDERITAIVPVPEESENRFVCMATAKGLIKRTKLDEFSIPRRLGKIAISLQEDDELIGVHITDGHQELMLVQSAGYAVRFKESDVRSTGRNAQGVKGIQLRGTEERVLSFVVPQPDCYLLCASEYGYGKCSDFSLFRRMNRATRGVYALKPSERHGRLTCAVQVFDSDEVMFINDRGVLLRTAVSQIAKSGRMTIGVKLIDLKDEVRLVGVAVIHEDALAHFEDDVPKIDDASTDTNNNETEQNREGQSSPDEDN